MVDFRVLSDVKANGKIVISAGSIAQGQITRAKREVYWVLKENWK